MKFGYGLITCQRYPGDRRSDQDLYEEALQLAVEAEQAGFDSLWVAEHHFWNDSWMPSPLPVLGAMAGRTASIQLATGIMQAPLHSPVLLAEEAATVDLLSKGRLLLGLGIGWRPIEFDAMEVPIKQRAGRTEETIELLRRAWSADPITGEGITRLHVPEEGIEVFPKPVRPGGPPIWLGGFVEPAARRAGRIADGWLAHGCPIDHFEQEVGWIRSELREDRPFEFGLCIPCLAWNYGPARDAARDHFYYYNWKYADVGWAAASRSAAPSRSVPAPPPFGGGDQLRQRDGALHTLATKATENIDEDQMAGVFGTPAEVADLIRRYAEVVDGELHFVAQLYMAGMTLERHVEALEIFAEEVIPRVQRG